MKLINQMLLLTVAGLGLIACSDDNPWRGVEGEGGIRLKLQASGDVKDAIPLLRSGAPDFEVPEVEDFSVSLENIATGEVKTWDSLTSFNSQSSFATGSYTLTAFYGSIEDEGFEKPCFQGSTEVTVLESRQADVEVLATLANAMVSVEYTDKFKNYFKSWTPTVHSEGHAYIVFPQDETRPAFIAPGEVSLSIEVTNPSGKSVTLQPAAFPAEARHHYHVTFDVNQGATGDQQLQIVFDDSVETEDVMIDLTDELFSSPAPAVNPFGFTDGQVIEALEGSPLTDPVRFDVLVKGGLTSAILTVEGENFTPVFGNEIDLVKATASQQAQLAEMGIKVVGLYKNPDKFAYVDLSNLSAHLPKGKTSVSLVAKDAFTRVSTPLTVHFTNVPVVVDAEDGTAILGNRNATIEVAYNGVEPQKNVTFKALSKAGVYKDCEVVEVKESAATRSFDVKNYIFTVALPDTEHEVIPVKVYFGGEERKQINVNVTVPEYSLAADALSTYVRLQVLPENPSEMAAIVSNLRFYNGSTQISAAKISRNAETGIITISDLTPATSYTLTHSLTALTTKAGVGQIGFTTESASVIPNGDFSATVSDINMPGVQVGGTYTGTIFGSPAYHYSAGIVRNMAEGWASVNAMTCYEGASNKNTWFCVPSTYEENGVMVVRSVGYNHNGTTPGVSKKTAQYYCSNTPSFTDAQKAAGELFLGSYTYDGSEHRNEGVAFSSRPASISFDYMYAPLANETAGVEVDIIDASGVVLASAKDNLSAASAMTTKTLSFPAYTFGSKAASIKVKFVSSTAAVPAITIPTGSALNEYSLNGVTNGLRNNTLADNAYHALATGSVLKVDNVKFNY